MRMMLMRYFRTIILISGIVFLSSGYALALTVSPVKLELASDPGGTVAGEFQLYNEQQEIKTLYSSYENFEARGEAGTPTFIPGEEGLATWIKTSSQITLKPGDRKIIPFSITIPKNADPGGYFAAVFWSTTPPQERGGGQVAVSAKVGILVLLKVSGATKEGGGLLEFGGQNKQNFFSSLPITFMYRFQNSGSDRIKPDGKIKIKNLFGGITATLPANKTLGNVLPGSIRKFEVMWTGGEDRDESTRIKPQIASEADQKLGFFGMVVKEWRNFTFGRYTANLNLKYGQDNKEAAANYSFFVIPWQLLSVLLAMVAVLGCIAFIGIKKYNRWIIAKAIGSR